MLETIIFLACFIGFFYWAAFVPLPEDRELPKDKRPPTIGEAYLNTLKK